MGNYEGKYNKLMAKAKGALRDMKGKKSVGVIEIDEERKLMKIAKPVGVIGALVPCTNPEVTPTVKIAHAIKGKNAIILSPHPRTKKTNALIVKIVRETLKKYNAPEDLVIGIDEPTMEISSQLMKQTDLVLATGGTGLVKAAYSSGTPAYGVGAGNAVVVVDETADLKDAASKIRASKTFDYATSCSAENSIIVQSKVYDAMLDALKAEGGYLVDEEEKKRLQTALWIDGHLNPEIIAQSAQEIARIANTDIPEETIFIMVEEEGIGKDYPFSGEKLSVILTVYKYHDFQEAVDKVNEITNYQGRGHSCGIHSFNEENIMKLALETKVSRMNVNQGQALANTGKGVQSHGSMPYEGVNAIENMVKVINAIDKKIRPLLMADSKYPIQPIECRKSTLTITTIEAGNKVNTVPNRCKATFDWRLIPEQSVSWAKEKILSICEELKSKDPNFDYEFNVIMEVEPTIVPDDTDVVNAFLKAGNEYLGKEMDFSLSPGSDDQKYVVKEGNMEECIVYGPGPLVLAHKVDEYVKIEDMKNSAKIMALATAMLLGVEE